MKKYLIGLMVLVAALSTGCAATFQSIGKDIQYGVDGGLNQEITLYTYNGTPFYTKKGKLIIEGFNDETDAITFLEDKKRTHLSICDNCSYLIQEF